MTILPQTQKSSNTKNQLLRKDNSNNGKRHAEEKPFFGMNTISIKELSLALS